MIINKSTYYVNNVNQNGWSAITEAQELDVLSVTKQ